MLLSEPTKEEINNWKRIYCENRPLLSPNRIPGTELDAYFKTKYSPKELHSAEFENIVIENILSNEASCEKLSAGTSPHIAAYSISDGNILIGIDLVTGFFHIESEDISKMEEIHDDLFFHRGLDEKDLENFFLVAQYIQCRKKEVQLWQ